ncbi:hypothetical protein EJ05DRAFT_89589 [Pseudovirgaria hyperparasitica]|uniref:Uncharacterized protein n=1 Tax=Pseudovirgaria hyperparasitica TaxID=470096 RepID=A0A6A6W0P8_9PEZI|nr:uncharacterized protein EJ05DRAFT_89589 [Pseudovirgaria hyperparasitica]KAF2756085.1 hypothetical protein EJ05DRAFT_89589 [Pseudovirgaria hyperparasitica]
MVCIPRVKEFTLSFAVPLYSPFHFCHFLSIFISAFLLVMFSSQIETWCLDDSLVCFLGLVRMHGYWQSFYCIFCLDDNDRHLARNLGWLSQLAKSDSGAIR